MEDNEQQEAVYGISYEDAHHEMQVQRQAIALQNGIGFNSKQECADWAHDNLLDILAFSSSYKKFFNVSHKGELLQPDSFLEYYRSILFYWEQQNNGNKKAIQWLPEGFEYYDNARLPGELEDGIHKPLYYRDYARPTGYFNKERACFNIAKPFPYFAKQTGRDTSHIYTLIEHIAGECAMWLLAWLRAKMVNPTAKTQVVPIIVSRAQGSGKSTFGEVICKGLFGKDNVLVTDQYDSQSRFNADYADSLIVCMEEKEETDRRNTVAAIKSRATATTIRKEQKGIDPIYQESYTDFLMTTNKDVPIKFDGREDQRRFMIMQADENFTRKTSPTADEVFSRLYGFDADGNKVGIPFIEDKELIEQFKHELFTREDIKNIKLRQFPKTAAYNRCFTLPRTTESTEIESILRALAPYILESLKQNKTVTELPELGPMSNIVQYTGAMQFMPASLHTPKYVALCRPLVFYDMQTNKPYQHAVVERCVLDCKPWLLEEYGIDVLPNMESLPGGFTGVQGRYKVATTARFALHEDQGTYTPPTISIGPGNLKAVQESVTRIGTRLRVNNLFRADVNGCYETVNEMKPGTKTLCGNKTANVQYMDTFLFESDDCTGTQYALEKDRAEQWKKSNGDVPIESLQLYKERLGMQRAEATRMFNSGIACRVVYSGSKSYHILVRIADAPKTAEEYSWLHAYLCTTLSDKVLFDVSTSDPARLTRSPVTLDRMTYNTQYGISVKGTQELICEDWKHIYSLQWHDLYEQWLNRPLKPYENKGKRLIPTKPEYKEAMEAIINGTFWIDSNWDGRRQQTFFPAYRLLRSLGYTHDELWADIVLQNIDGYAKQSEIGYWKSRESSSIIKQIDEDFNNDTSEQ